MKKKLVLVGAVVSLVACNVLVIAHGHLPMNYSLPNIALTPSAEPSMNPRTRFLLPGEVEFGGSYVQLSTILGSCVALCLWDRRLAVGGMNHVLLPEGGPEVANPYRYANLANPELLRRLTRIGCTRRNLVARVYGGAAINASPGGQMGRVSERNVDATLAFLHTERIPLAWQDTGGSRGRKIFFDIATGEVSVTQL